MVRTISTGLVAHSTHAGRSMLRALAICALASSLLTMELPTVGAAQADDPPNGRGGSPVNGRPADTQETGSDPAAAPTMDEIFGSVDQGGAFLEDQARAQQRLNLLQMRQTEVSLETAILNKMVERESLRRVLAGEAPLGEPPAENARPDGPSAGSGAHGRGEVRPASARGSEQDRSAVEPGQVPAEPVMPTVVSLTGTGGSYNAVLGLPGGGRVRVHEGQSLGTKAKVVKIGADGVWLEIEGRRSLVLLERGSVALR